jgi:hypothetical protein
LNAEEQPQKGTKGAKKDDLAGEKKPLGLKFSRAV